MANISNVDECDLAVSNLADGIGLVRTEILFINSNEMPDKKHQCAVYSKIIKNEARTCIYKDIGCRRG